MSNAPTERIVRILEEVELLLTTLHQVGAPIPPTPNIDKEKAYQSIMLNSTRRKRERATR